jgi:hypothetical protein
MKIARASSFATVVALPLLLASQPAGAAGGANPNPEESFCTGAVATLGQVCTNQLMTRTATCTSNPAVGDFAEMTCNVKKTHKVGRKTVTTPADAVSYQLNFSFDFTDTYVVVDVPQLPVVTHYFAYNLTTCTDGSQPTSAYCSDVKGTDPFGVSYQWCYRPNPSPFGPGTILLPDVITNCPMNQQSTGGLQEIWATNETHDPGDNF